MLAVLKAGAAYLPLPADYPPERLRYMMADADARAVVTSGRLPSLVDDDRVAAVTVDDLSGLAANNPVAPRVDVPVHPTDLAYVIYTSGSTGQPKGVGVTHRGAVNLVHPEQTYVSFGPEEVFLQLAPIAFDAAAFEVWGALTNGAELVLAAPSYQAIDDLPRCLVTQRITTLLLTPLLFHAMMDRHPECFDGVRQLIVGGDVMSAAVAAAYCERKAALGLDHRLSNVYGPTEATTLVSHHPMRGVPASAPRIPLGRSIRGAAMYLLDQQLAPVPPGGRGEIYLGGSGVAGGYLNQPALTAARFVPDPFADDPGARMYATGDEGQLNDDGLIEYVGRLDDQVKVRGYRVELGEVEQTLRAHRSVRDACVVLHRPGGQTDQLVAHVVVAPGDPVDPRNLVAHLRETLPEYMVPQHFVNHDALPVTATGKADRRALTQHSIRAPEPAGQGATAYGDPVQDVMAELWRSVLQVDTVPPDADFFALGGDSLLAIRLMAEAEARGLAVRLADLFNRPVLRDLCAGLAVETDRLDAADDTGMLSAADRGRVPQDIEAAYPASRLQLGMIFESLMSDSGIYIDVISRDVNLPLVPNLLRQAIDEATLRHPVLRTRFDLATFTEPLQLVERIPAVPLRLDDYSALSPQALADRHEATMHALAEPFDPEVAPLLRMHAAILDEHRFRLSYGFNHAILDGWSESVLLLELLRGYDALLKGSSVAAEEPAPLAEFIRLERDALRDERSRAYFRRFAGADRAPHLQKPQYRTVTAPVPPDAVVQLTANTGRWGVPLKSQLFAAYYSAVAACWAEPAPVVGLSVNGRPELPGADRTLGLFLNHLPIRLDWQSAPSWEALSRLAFAAETEVLAHRRFPYSEIVKEVGGAPFEVAFSYTHLHRRDELLGTGLIGSDEDIRDHTNLPVRVELINDPLGLGMRLRVTVDEQRYGERRLGQLTDQLLRGIDGLARRSGEVPAGRP
jgi:amino acid adenylation domain-containing protein